jgi:hypothetical protein
MCWPSRPSIPFKSLCNVFRACAWRICQSSVGQVRTSGNWQISPRCSRGDGDRTGCSNSFF